MDGRRNVSYRVDPDDPTLDEFESPERFIENAADPFLEAIDDLIQNEFGEKIRPRPESHVHSTGVAVRFL